mmetsp:Transcript_43678/g.87427  ORF Transcript_43678/g.87427 Transcript_43678/m.87427 type:complete len:233 (-) Transcript_43678:325-1023(-)
MVLPRQGGGIDLPSELAVSIPDLGPRDGPEEHDPFCTHIGHKHYKRLQPLSPMASPTGELPDGAVVPHYSVPDVQAYRKTGPKGFTFFGHGHDRFTMHRMRHVPPTTASSYGSTQPWGRRSDMIPYPDPDKYKPYMRGDACNVIMIPPSKNFGPFRRTIPASWEHPDLITPIAYFNTPTPERLKQPRGRSAESFLTPTKSKVQHLRSQAELTRTFGSSEGLIKRTASAASLF